MNTLYRRHLEAQSRVRARGAGHLLDSRIADQLGDKGLILRDDIRLRPCFVSLDEGIGMQCICINFVHEKWTQFSDKVVSVNRGRMERDR